MRYIMPLELAEPLADAGRSRPGIPLDAQLRAAAPGHAHHAAPDPDARRRNGRQGRARHRLPAQRLREARRRPRLQPVRHHRRPDELHLAARQRDRLAPRRREAAGHRADAALQVHPHDLRRADADPRPPALRRRRRARPRCASPPSCTPSTSASRSTTSARRPPGSGSIPATRASAACMHDVDDDVGSRKVRDFVKDFPKAHADVARLLNRNRIFVDRMQGHRRPVEGRGHQPQLHRADRPGQRRRPRPAQGRAVPRLPRLRFQGRLCHGRRLLRPLPGAHGGDAGEHQDRPRRRSRTCRPVRSTSTSRARWCCRTSWRPTAASRG